MNQVGDLPIYIDGADESTKHLHLIKGGGAALTREKIVTAVSREFICIADESKLVHTLGKFPLPVEVIPMARSHVARELVKLGGDPVYREGVVTDNGNVILDVYNFSIPQPLATEEKINNITGVVTNGLFGTLAFLILTGRMMDAEEAERSGLVSRIVPADQMMDEAVKAAETIASYSKPSTMVAKEAVDRAFEVGLAEGLNYERRTFFALFATEDQTEGMEAFIEKRPPNFKHK